MDERQVILRVDGWYIGSAREVISLLTDLEAAYDSLYAFEAIVDSLYQHVYAVRDQKRYDWSDILFRNRKGLGSVYGFLPSLYDLVADINIGRIVLPEHRLQINKVSFQSPGFWEFLGSMNPMQQIREYLKDAHERDKDRLYRIDQERRSGELEIQHKQNELINQRIDTLKKLGYSEIEIREFIAVMVHEPLAKLDKYKDSGQLGEPQ
jgi:hypothetical protein